MVDNKIEDDSTVEDDHGLLRRIPNLPNMVKWDSNLKAYRPSSLCFSDRDGGIELSITLEQPLLSSGGSHHDAIIKMPGFGLARLNAGFVRHEMNPPQIINRAPTPEDPHHGLVIGSKSKKAKSSMAKAAVLIIEPDTIPKKG